MRKIIYFLLCFSSLFSEAATSSDRHSKHIEALKSKHPFGLIGDDFDILKEDDLTINECVAEPEPFSSNAICFPYWQCFNTKVVFFSCDHSEDQDPKEGIQALIAFDIFQDKTSHEYIGRRPWSLKSCKNFGKKFKNLTKNAKQVCFSGSLIDNKETDKKGRKHTSWIFEKYKTKSGCDSYFGGGCSLRYQIQNGCKVSENIGHP